MARGGITTRRVTALLGLCAVFAAVGVALAFAGSVLEPGRALFARLGEVPEGGARFARLVEGILGASIAGRWTATAWIVHVALRRGDRWAARAILLSHAVWLGIAGLAVARAGTLWLLALDALPALALLGLTLGLALRPAERAPAAPRLRGVRRVLLWICAFSIGTGAMTLAIRTAPFDLYNAAIADHFFGGPMSLASVAFERLGFGLIGAAVAAHFVILTAVMWRAGHERWAPWAVLTSMSAWFFVDSAICVAEGAWFNIAMVNLPSFLAAAVPATWAIVAARGERAGPIAYPERDARVDER